MKFSQVLTSIILPLSAAAAARHNLGDRKGAVAELDGTEDLNLEKQEIGLLDDESGMEHVFRCPRNSDTQLSFTDDQKYVACCSPDQHLSGTAETAFDCCGEGHDITGSAKTGYTCCPTGQEYDGKICYKPKPVCENGKVLVDGECACPPGTTEAADGTCKKDAACESGLQEGMLSPVSMAPSPLSNNFELTPDSFSRQVLHPEDGQR